jgi:hypothetical protein
VAEFSIQGQPCPKQPISWHVPLPQTFIHKLVVGTGFTVDTKATRINSIKTDKTTNIGPTTLIIVTPKTGLITHDL